MNGPRDEGEGKHNQSLRTFITLSMASYPVGDEHDAPPRNPAPAQELLQFRTIPDDLEATLINIDTDFSKLPRDRAVVALTPRHPLPAPCSGAGASAIPKPTDCQPHPGARVGRACRGGLGPPAREQSRSLPGSEHCNRPRRW